MALTDGSRDVLLGSKQGMAIRFSEDEMRPIGRAAMGVKSMELDEGDEVVDMSVVEDGAQVLSITENGYGKRTEIDEYRLQGPRAARASRHEPHGQDRRARRTVAGQRGGGYTHHHRRWHRHPHAGELPFPCRAATRRGVRLMRVQENSRVVCVARAEAEEEAPEEPEEDGEDTAQEPENEE